MYFHSGPMKYSQRYRMSFSTNSKLYAAMKKYSPYLMKSLICSG